MRWHRLSQKRVWLIVIAAFALESCDGPAAPSLTPPQTPGSSTELVRLTGQVSSLQGSEPVAGAKGELISNSISTFSTDAAGGFAFDAAPGSLIYTLTAPGFLQRRAALMVSGPRSGLAFNMISLQAPFSLEFYRQLVRNSIDRPSGYSETNPWPYDPRFYIRTVTEDTGEIVPDSIVGGVRRVLTASVPELSAGRLKAAEIRVGTAPMLPAVGWVEVSFVRAFPTGIGGQATVGLVGARGYIRLKYLDEGDLYNPRNCESGTVFIAEHEAVHTMGFFHTDSTVTDFQSAGTGCLGVGRTSRVTYHAAIMYSRPAGNLDPDYDPVASIGTASVPKPTVVSCILR